MKEVLLPEEARFVLGKSIDYLDELNPLIEVPKAALQQYFELGNIAYCENYEGFDSWSQEGNPLFNRNTLEIRAGMFTASARQRFTRGNFGRS